MYMPARPPEPRNIPRSPDGGRGRRDSAKRGGLLSSLTLTIGGLMFKCRLEVERVDDLRAAATRPQAHPVIRSRRRHTLQPGGLDSSQASYVGTGNKSIGKSPLIAPRAPDGADTAFWETLEPAEREAYRSVALPGTVRSIPAGEATARWPSGRRHADRPVPYAQPLNGENCTIILSDVAGFGARTRTDEDRRIIREALLSITHTVLQDIPDVWSWDDRGDGLLTVIPPSVPTGRIIEQLHRELPGALEEHNRAYHEAARIHLRVAICVGPVASYRMGVSGEAIIVTARLVDAPILKKAMEISRASLGVIASTFIYESVIRHTQTLAGYSEVQVNVKESSLVAWMKLFETAPSADIDHAVAS